MIVYQVEVLRILRNTTSLYSSMVADARQIESTYALNHPFHNEEEE